MVPEVLTAFFSKSQADEKAEIKWPLEPWSADPEQVTQEGINIRTAVKKIDVWMAGNGNLSSFVNNITSEKHFTGCKSHWKLLVLWS